MAAIAYPGEQRTMTVSRPRSIRARCKPSSPNSSASPSSRVIVQCNASWRRFRRQRDAAAQPAAMAAWVAQLTGRPARDRARPRHDMAMTGQAASVSREVQSRASPTPAESPRSKRTSGRTAAAARRTFRRQFSNARCLHIDNAYYLPAAYITGNCCRTNLPSNTAFRGFGGTAGRCGDRETSSKKSRSPRVATRTTSAKKTATASTSAHRRSRREIVVANNVLPRLSSRSFARRATTTAVSERRDLSRSTTLDDDTPRDRHVAGQVRHLV